MLARPRRYSHDDPEPIIDMLARRPSEPILLVHLGRGGVQQNGELDAYNRRRVENVIALARALQAKFPERDIAALFTGRCNRKQDRLRVELPATEADAALEYAQTLCKLGDRFVLGAERRSTSTMENAINTARSAMDNGILVILTDPLHYLGGKVTFIMRLVFPQRRIIFVELPDRLKVTFPDMAKQLLSAVITRIGMIGVARGDLNGIKQRQIDLQEGLRH